MSEMTRRDFMAMMQGTVYLPFIQSGNADPCPPLKKWMYKRLILADYGSMSVENVLNLAGQLGYEVCAHRIGPRGEEFILKIELRDGCPTPE